MGFEILKTDKSFTDSPDAGHPDCICSRCAKEIPEQDAVIRAWPSQDAYGSTYTFGEDIKDEYRYCEQCQEQMGIVHVADHWFGMEDDLFDPLLACRECGCTEIDACVHQDHGPCWWVEPDLCSHCKNWPGEALRKGGNHA